ncbi:MAG: CxxxxCH/CxxCH domain-containing protein [Myxococcales bacterium]|nr:MAG: CxxxxCH/CxxCH domain-containing protein [Myxococcales bacterium]
MNLRWVLIATFFVTACTKEKEPDLVTTCVNWTDDVAPVFTEQCSKCHSVSSAAAQYDVTEYKTVLGANQVPPIVIAGSEESTLLRVLNPDSADAIHSGFKEVYDLVETWIVGCNAAYIQSVIHPSGIMNPGDEGFHGKLLSQHRWNFSLCENCHGEAAGESRQTPCTSCHTSGPTACETCHNDALYYSGAHRYHLSYENGVLDFEICNNCHHKPNSYSDAGHLFNEDGSVDWLPAEVNFGAIANFSPAADIRQGPAEYDFDSRQCSNVYCHGDGSQNSTALDASPLWLQIAEEKCNFCHAMPPESHAQDQCEACHQQVVGKDNIIINKSLHVDGIVQVGREGESGCTRCHGQSGSPAPPYDLAGHSLATFIGVGAHQSHTQALHRITAPIACNECHQEVTDLHSEGHIDTPLPAEVFINNAAVLATAQGAMPSWNRESNQCSDVYCHGGGALSDDSAFSVSRRPAWTTSGVTEMTCGFCHGFPPGDANHDPNFGFSDCVLCHTSVDEFGNTIVTGPPGSEVSEHINGVINVR